MHIAISSICAIHVDNDNFTIQYATKPVITVCSSNDSPGTKVDSGTESVISFRVHQTDNQVVNFTKSLFMIFARSMQDSNLKTFLGTPIQHGVHVGDSRLHVDFFSTSRCARRGKHVALLDQRDPEHVEIKQRLIAGKVAVDEDLIQSADRIKSTQDPYRFTCPGCKRLASLSFDAWDITSDDCCDHTTCPVLDKDPSKHVVFEDVQSSPVAVITQREVQSVQSARVHERNPRPPSPLVCSQNIHDVCK